MRTNKNVETDALDELARIERFKELVASGEQLQDSKIASAGEAPYIGESESDFARRLLIDKYGIGNYPIGPGSEFNQIKKFGDQGFR